MRALCNVLVLIMASMATSKADTLISQPESALNVIPPVNASAYSGLIGDSSIKTPTWQIAQWNNPQPISGSIRTTPNIDWTVNSGTDLSTSAYSITHSAAYNAYVLTTNIQSHNSPSFNYLTCGTEADFFLGGNGLYTVYNSTANAASRQQQSAPVGSLTVLSGTINMGIDSETLSTQYCSESYISYSFNITLNDLANGQAMFYQIIIRGSAGLPTTYTPCIGYPTGSPAVFCYSIGITGLFGLKEPAPGANAVVYNFNLLPGLVKLIKFGYYGMDPNPSNWIVTGFYMGQGGVGDFNVKSVWNEMSLTSY